MLDYVESRGEVWNSINFIADDPLALIEFGGRVCYQSWENRAGRDRWEYLHKQLIGHEHFSVLRHVYVNLAVSDVPRSTQLETVRHSVGIDYSWESTRFTDKRQRFVIPPRYRETPNMWPELFQHFEQTLKQYQKLVKLAERDTDEGTLKRKRALEAARSILPNALGSDGLITANLQALRHVINQRTDVHADLSIREFFVSVFNAVNQALPQAFSDAEFVFPEGEPAVIRLTG
jgi:thymidylate synthase (FAD)